MNTLGVVLFHTSSAALRAEKVLLAAGMTVKLIPTPRQFSSDCGIALQFAWQDRQTIEAHLAGARVEAAGFHPMPWRVTNHQRSAANGVTHCGGEARESCASPPRFLQREPVRLAT